MHKLLLFMYVITLLLCKIISFSFFLFTLIHVFEYVNNLQNLKKTQINRTPFCC